jgi:hypothetical protein
MLRPMRRICLLSTAILFLAFFFLTPGVEAGPGDTTTIQTFTFGSKLENKFLFPDSTHRWGKILMYYTLKCNPDQSPACGEWDYLTYTYLFRHTGKFDSTMYTLPNFTLWGSTPDSLMYMNTPSFGYKPYFEYFNHTVPSDTIVIGQDVYPAGPYFNGSSPDKRSQVLLTPAELTAAGLQTGWVTGLRLKFTAVSSRMIRLMIRMKNAVADSLDPENVDNSGFTEVFARGITFPSAGWQVIPFTYPFEWDGISGVLLDISYTSSYPENEEIACDGEGSDKTLTTAGEEWFLSFHGHDAVKIPAAPMASLDSSITITCWQYGDPGHQPQNGTLFEGTDSAGHRLLNVHLPWSDGKVYWDAGWDSAGYDRIYRATTTPSQYKGKWNHWAFTKDVKTGKMKIYLNGQLWALGTTKKKSLKGVTAFRIGSNSFGTDLFYWGSVDEFAVWNKELSDTMIRTVMYKDIDASHPEYSHLVAYYQFNTAGGLTTSATLPVGNSAKLEGYPVWTNYQGKDRFRNMQHSVYRPYLVLEQGNYDPSSLDSVMKVDTVAYPRMMVILFGDSAHPYTPTDTLTKYPGYYDQYVFNSQGTAIDSTLVPPDGILKKKLYTYYGEPFEVTERYELARYITPYGNNLSLGNGWTWVYDVTDYAPFLHDSVHLSAGNWQELLDMKFGMIEGIPPRDVVRIQNIYTGTHGYANAGQHNLPPVKVMINPVDKNARLKMRITGHGFGGNLDCSEFCARTNSLFINGDLAYTHYVWRADCPSNPLYPQGGTWLYPRAEWCPGAEVRTKDFELSSYLVAGDSLTIDYDLQPGYTWNGQGSWPYYAIESQLITYGTPNFTLDAAMEEIISPNKGELYKRFNPVCGSPVISIKNNGTDVLTGAKITYGPVGGRMQVYDWTGHLSFQDTAKITLPPVDWADWTGGDNRFTFTISEPNGGTDQYSFNNTMTSGFEIPPVYDNVLVFHMKTNHQYYAESWTVEDQDGNILYHNDTLEANTEYIDTFQLAKGCYKLTIRNAEGEGLRYWANMPPYGNGTAGWADIRQITGQTIKSFQADFGSFTSQVFTVGMNIQVEDLNPGGYLNIYPNPGGGLFNLAVVLPLTEDITVIIHDILGNERMKKNVPAVSNSTIPLDLTGYGAGIYMVTVVTRDGSLSRKLVVR